MFGHLNNTVPFIYFEQIRTEFFHYIGFMQKWTSEHEERYRWWLICSAIMLNKCILATCYIVFVKAHRIGRSSVDLHYMIQNEQREVVLPGEEQWCKFLKKREKACLGMKR